MTQSSNHLTVRAQATATALHATALLARPGSAQPGVRWASPAPLWPVLVAQHSDELTRPALLTLASDDFMPEILARLASAPDTLETFRQQPGGSPLKLFQAMHGHFNLVAASLVCRRIGLPDRRVESGERVASVLRRLREDGSELAWTVDPQGGKFWDAAPANALALGADGEVAEDLQALFPAGYCLQNCRRQLWLGLIPTSSGESFRRGEVVRPVLPPDDPVLQSDLQKMGILDPRLMEVYERVILPLNDLRAAIGDQPRQESEAALFLLLDLAEFLQGYGLLGAMLAGTAPALSSPGRALYDQLTALHLNKGLLPGAEQLPWSQVMQRVWTARSQIESGQTPDELLHYSLRETDQDTKSDQAKLQANLLAAIGNQPAPMSGAATPPPTPKLSGDGTRYVVRLVLLRPGCPPVLSEATQPFEIAPFFDPDAPVRPLHITLPDTSLASLRKFKKNVSFAVSSSLRNQMECMSNPKEILKGNLSTCKSLDLGMICSFSIPIITICAFVVLMIFLLMLNIVFWWLPFFKICFPVPKPR